MKILQIVIAVLVLLAGILAALLPIGPAPGFFIGGTPTEAPAEWQDTSGIHEIKLKINGTLPRVVIIWVIKQNKELYIVGAKSSGWVSMLGDGAPVEMRMGDNTYSLNAERVTEDVLSILTAYGDKYRPDYPEIVAGFGEPEDFLPGTAVFKLVRVGI